VGTHPDDFPQVLDVSDIDLFPVKSDVLMDMVQKTIFSVSTDDARPNLTGAFFRLTDDNAILMVSTDGHRLSKVESPAIFEAKGATSDQLKDGIIIPRKGLSELKRTVDAKSEELSFGLKQNNLVFQNGPMTLAIRLIDGTFPNFTQILPKESDNKSVVSKETLHQALKFVSLFSSPKTSNVRLSLSENALELYATDPDKGEGLKTLPVSYSGAAVKAGYNHRYLAEVLSAIDGDEVSIEIIDTLSPTLIRDTERDEALYVVMPMRL
jgi:DNA polymerase-3 subunit beta